MLVNSFACLGSCSYKLSRLPYGLLSKTFFERDIGKMVWRSYTRGSVSDVNDARLAMGEEDTTKKEQKICVEEIKREICMLEILNVAYGMLK